MGLVLQGAYDSDIVLNSFLDKFNAIYDDYKYACISKDEYFNLVKKIVISLKKDHYDDHEYDTYIIDNIKSEISQIVESNLYDDTNGFRIINSYINQKFIPINNYDGGIENLNKFTKFLETYDYKISEELLTKLIEENNLFSNSIREVVKSKIDFIQCGKLGSVFKNLNVQLIIKLYCIINGIEINDYIDETMYFDDSYKAFLAEIKKIPILTNEEEKELLYEAKKGNKKARDKLVNSNLRFVVKVVNNFVGRGVPPIDLVQEGSIGLIDAVKSFDMSKDTKFLTYAYYHVKSKITKSIYDNGRNIRLPGHIHASLNKYNNAVNELADNLKRNPNIEEVANYMNISIEKVQKLMLLQDDTVSINTLISENIELGDLVADKKSLEDDFMFNSLIDDVNNVLESGMLDDREKQIIRLRFGFEDGRLWTLKEIGDRFGITGERVKQIETNVLKRLKYSLSSRSLIGYSIDPDRNIKNIKSVHVSKRTKQLQNHKEDSIDNTIYENFKDYTKDQINSVIYNLDTSDIKIIKKRYGENFVTSSGINDISKIDLFKFYTFLIPKMKIMLVMLYGRGKQKSISKKGKFGL